MTNNDNLKYAQVQPFTLAGAGCSLGDTSVILNTMLDIDGNQLTMTNFGTLGFGTIEPNNSSQEEQISFTGITVNANGTVTLTGVKNVAFLSPYTTTSGVLKTHPGGAKFIISNTSGFYDQMTSKDNDETINGVYTFTQSPVVPTPDGLTSSQVASVGYVNTIAINGAAKASSTVFGIAELSVDPVTASVPIAVGNNDTRVSPVSLASLTASTVAAFAGTGGTPSATNAFVTSQGLASATSVLVSSLQKFGGTGASGALAISAGTTTINLGNSSVVVINYTSISITGTGVLAFSNPNTNGTIVILKSQGNVTITSSANPTIDLRSIGGAAGSAGTSYYASPGAGAANSTTTGGAGGTGITLFKTLANKSVPASAGAGGGAGGGAAGAGAGSLVIECAGAYNFGASSVINASGANGVSANASGGGGGAGGSVVVIYNTLTANSGTYTLTGGTGGGSTGGFSAGGGGGGGNRVAGGLAGNNNTSGAAGTNDDGTGGSGGGAAGGGGGAGGWKLIVPNTEYV